MTVLAAAAAPFLPFDFVHRQGSGLFWKTVRQFGRTSQIPLGHQVGVDVVVGDGAVLIGPGDPVDAKTAPRIVVPKRHPEPGRGHQQLQAGPGGELVVSGRPYVAHHRLSHVGVDVHRGCGSGPVA